LEPVGQPGTGDDVSRDPVQSHSGKRHFRGHWNMENTKPWVEMFREKRMPATQIAAEVGADPRSVSTWLKRHGVEIYAGLHRAERDPPKVSPELLRLLGEGPEEVLKLLDGRVWGVHASPSGLVQLTKFCRLVQLPLDTGVVAAKEMLQIDRSMVRAWAEGVKRPYLVGVAEKALQEGLQQGWKLLPLRIRSGGNEQGSWIQVPVAIQGYGCIPKLLDQLKPLERTYERCSRFGISVEQATQMRTGMLAYLIGMMVGDSAKLGGKLQRFTSSNLSLSFTKKHPDNERLGEFTSMCVNNLGLEMNRIKDGEPSGATKLSREPTGSYRWNSQRSPLLAWIFFVAMGMKTGETTRDNPVRMDWIFNTPFEFRKRFIQGLADSDGCARDYVVEICSVPNADFTTRLLRSLGMTSAYTRKESGRDLRSVVRNKEAALLPIFNEFTGSYRYHHLMRTT
jgi:hypothetical protein